MKYIIRIPAKTDVYTELGTQIILTHFEVCVAEYDGERRMYKAQYNNLTIFVSPLAIEILKTVDCRATA